MAYTLTDPFRAIRGVLRFNGVAFLLLALGLLAATLGLLGAENPVAVGPLWPPRLAAAGLATLGVYFLLAAAERFLATTALATCMMGNSLVALVILLGYLGREFDGLNLPGQLLLIAVFAICLVGAVAPIRYLRADYRND
jgi:hypothetical protein